MTPPPTIPTVTSSALRVRRHRQRRAGLRATGYAAITRAAALEVRRRMFERHPGRDVYGTGITTAILRAMHLLVRTAGPAGEVDPVAMLLAMADDYRPPENPVHFLNRAVGAALEGWRPDDAPIELGVFDPLAGL